MLSAEHRLRHKKDFDTAFAKGAKTSGPRFGMRYAKRYKPDVPTRFGFVVGTKVSKDSVVRNLLKRRMREVVREFVARIPVGLDIVVTAFPEAKDLDFAGVKTEFEKMFMKATLLR